MEDIKITAENIVDLVNYAFENSLYKEGEDTYNCVEVEGIIFNSQRLEEQRELVRAILAELPTEFNEGYTLLKICTNKNDRQWTGKYRTYEKLVSMAISLGLISYLLPKEKRTIQPSRVTDDVVK